MILAILLLYAVFCVLLIVVLLKMPTNIVSKNQNTPKVSVIIPIRNERKNLANLLDSLVNQTYSNFEVLIIDDNSTDHPQEILDTYITNVDLHYYTLGDRNEKHSPKKTAITKAISLAKGTIIACTDGDCVVKKQWLELLVNEFNGNKIQFVSAPVKLNNLPEKRIWSALQQIEFSSLIASGAASIGLNQPNMCSGANIAYRKDAFIKVNGYEGNLEVASGDDEFLMHKISKAYPGEIAYLKNNAATVNTQACKNLNQFYMQRKRWSSKWSKYKSITPTLLAIFVFMANLAFIWALLSFNTNAILIKLLPEFIFLSGLQIFFETKKNIAYIVFLQIAYPFYVVFFGLVSLFPSSYNWKNRKFK